MAVVTSMKTDAPKQKLRYALLVELASYACAYSDAPAVIANEATLPVGFSLHRQVGIYSDAPAAIANEATPPVGVSLHHQAGIYSDAPAAIANGAMPPVGISLAPSPGAAERVGRHAIGPGAWRFIKGGCSGMGV